MSENATPESGRPSAEQLRRERELLLTPFDPSEFDFPADSGSFAALSEHVNRPEPPASLPRPDEEPTT